MFFYFGSFSLCGILIFVINNRHSRTHLVLVDFGAIHHRWQITINDINNTRTTKDLADPTGEENSDTEFEREIDSKGPSKAIQTFRFLPKKAKINSYTNGTKHVICGFARRSIFFRCCQGGDNIPSPIDTKEKLHGFLPSRRHTSHSR